MTSSDRGERHESAPGGGTGKEEDGRWGNEGN